MNIKLKGNKVPIFYFLLVAGGLTLYLIIILFSNFDYELKRIILLCIAPIIVTLLLLMFNQKRESDTAMLKIENGILTVASINLFGHLNRQTIDLNEVKEVKKTVKVVMPISSRMWIKKYWLRFDRLVFVFKDNRIKELYYQQFDKAALDKLILELKANYKNINVYLL